METHESMSDQGDYSKLADQAMVLIIGRSIGYVSTIVLGVILVRMLTKSEYGTFLQVNLIVTILPYVVILGLPAALFYFIPQLEFVEVKRFILQNQLILFSLALISVVILYESGHFLVRLMNNMLLGELIGFIIVLLVLRILAESIEPTLISLNRATWLAGLNIASAGGNIVLTILVLWLGLGLEGIFTGMAVVLAIRILVMYVFVLRLPGSIHPLLTIKGMTEQLKFSFPVGCGRMVSSINAKVDQVMISSWYNPEIFAIYGRGAFNVPVFPIVTRNVSNVILPKLVELGKANNRKDFLYLWHESIKKISLITLPVCVFCFLFGKELFTVLFTEAYLDSVPIFLIYLCVVPLETALYGHVHQAFGRTKHIFIANGLAFPLTIVLMFVFHWIFGFIGPALAMVVTKTITIGYHWRIIKDYLSVPFVRVFPLLYQGKILGISMIAGALIFPIKWMSVPIFVTLSASACLFGLSYLWLVNRLGFLSGNDKRVIKQWLVTFKPQLKQN